MLNGTGWPRPDPPRRDPIGHVEEPSLLSDLCRWVGVAIAVVGSVVVAPAGAGLLWRTASDWMRERLDVARAWLSRFLPFLRRHHQVVITDGIATGSGVGTPKVTAYGAGFSGSGTLEARIDLLQQQLGVVQGRLSELDRSLQQEVADRQQALACLEELLRSGVTQLRLRLEKQQQQAAVVDARGLPVLGLGIVLSGTPTRSPTSLSAWAGPSRSLVSARPSRRLRTPCRNGTRVGSNSGRFCTDHASNRVPLTY